ncbi:MAG TPA: hybrid sensor histidine kinase/response regulator [Chloroflexi bacterium]|nr:hybrid sensor histidine kinase/response regulator [Chloroflexota bacterium]
MNSTDTAAILVIEDDLTTRALLADNLRAQGHQAVPAKDGSQALDILQKESVDLILLDMMLPDIAGLTILEMLKANPELRHIPVIVISAMDGMDGIIKAIELGADDYVTKPFNSLFLKARIASSLEKKRSRDAVEAANKAKSEFVSVVSHELRTPMTAIKGYSDLLLAGTAGTLNDMQLTFLKTISANVGRMATLVSDLSDISRIEAGRLKLEFEALSIADVVDDIVRSSRQQIEARKQRVGVEIAENLLPVWGDRNRISQVLSSLLSNAYKYSSEGGEITIRVKNGLASDGNSAEAHLEIQDTGVGIHPEDREKVFEKFFRAKDGAVRDETGGGLGLSIAKNLVEMQGGRISFESKVGKGTTFYVTFPLASDE